MYYNLTIKSGDGEYSLNSENKEIIQREMDLYFACMFSASKDFVANIKKIELKDPKVKSINDFEEFSPKDDKIEEKENIQEKTGENKDTNNYIEPKVEQIIEPTTKEIIEEEEEEEEEEIQEKEIITIKEEKNQTNEELFFKPIQNPREDLVFYKNPTTNIKTNFENEIPKVKKPIIQEAIGYIKPENHQIETIEENTEIIEYQEIEKNIENAIPNKAIVFKNETKESSDKIENVVITDEKPAENNEIQSIRDSSIVSFKENSPNEINDEIVEISKQVSDSKEEKTKTLDKTIEDVGKAVKKLDILSDETFDIDMPEAFEEKSKNELNLEETDPYINEDDDEEDSNTLHFEFSKNGISSTITKTNEEKPIEQDKFNIPELIKQTSNTTENNKTLDELILENRKEENELSSMFSNEIQLNSPSEIQNVIAAKNYEEKKVFNLGFDKFLANYETKGLIDEFLVCAYYIKHVVGQNGFNMKYANSKLFQATGKIADFSIVDELVQNGYIKVTETDGQKRYSISADGEEYFMTHYQR